MKAFDYVFYYLQLVVSFLSSVDMGNCASFLTGVSLMQFIMALFIVITPIKIIANFKKKHNIDD